MSLDKSQRNLPPFLLHQENPDSMNMQIEKKSPSHHADPIFLCCRRCINILYYLFIFASHIFLMPAHYHCLSCDHEINEIFSFYCFLIG